MNINLEPVLSGLKDSIVIDEDVVISSDMLQNSSIKRLNNVHFVGKIKRLADLPLELEGKLTGTMILLDDLDLSEVDYDFNIEVNEEIEEDYAELIDDNKFDLLSLLWQLIQVEIPSKIHGNHKANNLSGDGWRLIDEDSIKKNNAFADLDKMLEERSQK